MEKDGDRRVEAIRFHIDQEAQESQVKKIKNVLMESIEKSKRQIFILGGGFGRDSWKRLIQDNPLLTVNAEFEDLVWRKM